MLRARDAMDRDYAEPLDIPALARIAYVSEAHFIRDVPRHLRRDAAPLPAAPPGRAGDVPAARDRPERDRHLLRRRFASLGTFSRTFTEIVGEPPSTYRWRAADLRAVPACFAKAWTQTEQFWRSGRAGRAG